MYIMYFNHSHFLSSPLFPANLSMTYSVGQWAVHRQPEPPGLEPRGELMGGDFSLYGTEGIRSCLLDPRLLSKLLPPQPPQERCVAISHVGAAPSLPTNERYLLSNPESPQKLYINPIQGIKGARELLCHLSVMFQEL